MKANRGPDGSTKLWISSPETAEWACEPGKRWPCSYLAGRRLYVEFDASGDLVDCAVNGEHDENVPGDEFSALTSDFLSERFGPDHPAVR